MHKQGRNPSPAQNPSFSSTLLDKIYRSIDDGGPAEVSVQEERLGSFERIVPSPIKGKCRENWAGGKALDSRMQGSGKCFFREMEMKPRDFDADHDATYFSSTSISSDSSSGGFSSSDSDSFHGTRTKVSCFAPLKLRPVKTHAVPARTEKEGHCGGALFHGDGEEGVVPKSRTSKVYETLKKVKQQPVSAGGRLTSILNSIFTSSTKKKGRSKDDACFDRKSNSGPGQGQVSTCSSATSFSRACLNGSFSSRSAAVPSREDLRDGTGTRSVRFSPVDVIVGEDHPRRPCGRTFHHNDPEGGKEFGSGRSRIVMKNLAELKKKWDEERNRVREAKCLEDMIRRNQVTRKVATDRERSIDDDDDDDGAGSCSSSDLFEIDHLAMIGDNGNAGLPFCGTTHGNKNYAVCKKSAM